MSTRQQASRNTTPQEKSKVADGSLLSPFHKKLAELVNSGHSLKSYKNVQVRLNVSPEIDLEITEHIKTWLRIGDVAHLAKVLDKYPKAISLAAIHQQIFHLSQLLRRVSEEEVYATGCSAGEIEPLPWGTKQAAHTALHRLLQAWVGRVLPGYNVEPKKYPRKRGPRGKTEWYERLSRLDEFNRLLEVLRRIDNESPTALYKKRTESRQLYLKRIAGVVERLHSASSYDWSSESFPEGGDPLNELVKKIPLPKGTAMRIAKRALPGKRLSKDKMLYGLLMHSLKVRTMKALSRRIEEAEAEFRDSHLRRAPLSQRQTPSSTHK